VSTRPSASGNQRPITSARSGAGTPRRLPPFALFLACALAAVFAGSSGPALALPPETQPADGFHWEPSLFWKSGNHRVDLGAETRFRTEWWDAHEGDTSTFYALRTRVRARYSYKDEYILFGEFQDAHLWSLGGNSSGAAAVYRAFSPGGSTESPDGQALRQLYAEVRPSKGLAIRGGRTDIKLGTEHMYKEANWKYLKVARASQRLIGTVGWTHGERSNDGGTLSYDTDGYNFFAFGAMPTTGVFDINKGYRTQWDIVYGGFSVTAKRGTWLPNTEIRPFFVYYDDNRPMNDGGLDNRVGIASFGFSAIGVYELGPGLADLFLWGAGQGGKYNGVDHWAGAGIVEAGYQLPKVVTKPWFRIGLNIASGGAGAATGGGAPAVAGSGNHNTFFNVLPTNHLYYGFADAFAFQNVIDLMAQVKLQLHERVGLNLMLHQFWLTDKNDNQYFGTGAFSKNTKNAGAFGYASNPSFGQRAVGTEIDTIVNVKVTKWLSVQGGFAYIWDGDVWQANPGFAGEDIMFGYLQFALKY
jgi:hypothetical protein